jgi:hypothetical protein
MVERVLLILLFLGLFPTAQTATIANCFRYTSSNTLCAQCNPGYYVSGGGASCSAYDCSLMAQCSLCDSTSTCLSCSFGYNLAADRQSCPQISCADSSCSLCATTSTGSCYTCLPSYYATSGLVC